MNAPTTTSLTDSIAISHLDWQPGCQFGHNTAPEHKVEKCQKPADFLVTLHWCLITGRCTPHFDSAFICRDHLDTFLANFTEKLNGCPRHPHQLKCGWCPAVFSTVSDAVRRVVPL
jgi:hypothetical protein